MSRRTQLKKPGLYLLQKQIRSFRKDGVAKAAGIWRKIRTQTEPLDLAIGQGDLDMGSRGGGGVPAQRSRPRRQWFFEEALLRQSREAGSKSQGCGLREGFYRRV